MIIPLLFIPVILAPMPRWAQEWQTCTLGGDVILAGSNWQGVDCIRSRTEKVFSVHAEIDVDAPPGHRWTTFPVSTPESQGLSAPVLEKLNETVRGYLRRDLILGAELLVIKNRRTVLHEVFGWKDRDDAVRMERGTICNIRSMTKPITGAAAQVLIDRGDLALTDRVAHYVPGFNNSRSRDITVEQLLTHRSGLPVSTLSSFHEYEDLHSMANAVGGVGPQYEIGSRFWYSDAGSDVLGAVVEKAAGVPLRQFVRERLFEPLGMDDSFTPARDDDPRMDRVASSYYAQAGSWIRFWKPGDRPLYEYAWGSQSLYSTPMDYARFLAMWMDGGLADAGRVLSHEAVTRTLTPVSRMGSLGSDLRTPSGFPTLHTYYGQMSVLYTDADVLDGGRPVVIGHSGSDGTWAWAWPELDLMVLYFTQSRGSASGLPLETVIDDLLVRPDIGRGIPEEYEPYTGTYLANFGDDRNEEFRVIVQNGRLSLVVPGVLVSELSGPDLNGKWRLVLDPSISVSFDLDASGVIIRMVLHDRGRDRVLPKIILTPVEDWRLHG